MIDTQTVHPHVCGEHLCCPTSNIPRFGSSPRMWGTYGHGCQHHQNKRFIPTYVGNISSTTNRMTPVTVHPHVCGEHSRSPERWVTCPGSSPRMWGTYPLRRVFSFEVRFIPTYVGNINSVDQAGFGPPVHPHVCGEHSATLKGSVKPIGSSPRMWGTYCRTPSRRTTTPTTRTKNKDSSRIRLDGKL